MLFVLAVEYLPAQRVLFGHLRAYLEDYILTLPVAGSNVYHDPDPDDLVRLGMAVDQIVAGNLTDAQAHATASGYEVIRYIDNSSTSNREFWGLQPQPGSTNYWGVLFWNPVACRNIVLQCPHPRFDSNTGLEGTYLFLNLDVKGLMISGTHRCNSIAPTACSGSTTACGSNAAYRISDIAHNDQSLFQRMTVSLSAFGVDYFIQLHGFAKSSGDPNLIISNGTRTTPEDDPIARLRDGLYAIDPQLTFKIVHIHTDWTKLTAFTNTQGRYLNESEEPCSRNATTATGRFIHIEQEYDRFRKDEAGWDLMREGLESAFTCAVVANHSLSMSPLLQIHILPDRLQIVYGGDLPLRITIATADGRIWYAGRNSQDQFYFLPHGVMCFLVVRDWEQGTLLAQKKIFLP
ncbi:MAG: hypothetical protein KDC57_08990 [Saprospiraceae bacterium]|nr:hypothetical protein [Saprospiraceae bacterium]